MMFRRELRGFTLIEILVAMVIATIIGLLSYRGLDSLLRSESRISEASARWLAVHRFLAGFEADLHTAVLRPGRDAGGTSQPALIGQPTAGLPFGAQLALMRPNDTTINDAPPLQRVAYRFVDNRIDLLLWPAADLPPYGKPKEVALLDGVKDFSLRFIGANDVWRENWPPGAQINAIPEGIEITLEMQDPGFGGPITRVIAR